MNNETLKALLTQAYEHIKSGNFVEAERLANQVLAELEEASGFLESGTLSDVETLHCSALLTLAESARCKGDYESALALVRASLALAEEHKLPQSIASAQNTIGLVYWNLGTYDKALEYYHKALAAYEELGEKSGVTRVTGNIGLVYRDLGSYDKAHEYYYKALAAHEELGQKSQVATVTGNIGLVYHGSWQLRQGTRILPQSTRRS